MKLFNSQEKKIEPFAVDAKSLTVTLCGMAPTSKVDLGHAFTYCAADVLVRYLEREGFSVDYGQIVTNGLSDPSQRTGSGAGNWRSIENEWVKQFIGDMRALNVRPPDGFLLTNGDTSQIEEADLLLLDHTCDKSSVQPATGGTGPAHVLTLGQVVPQENNGHDAADNGKPLRDLLEAYAPDAVRLYLAQQHYRQSWTYDEVQLKKASRRVLKLQTAMEATGPGSKTINVAPLQRQFSKAMDNDLDTAKGIATLINLADEILFRAPNDYLVDEAQDTLQRMASVFGIRLDGQVSDARVLAGWSAYEELLP